MYWVEFPVLYGRFLLVICFIYSSMYTSIPIPQFISPTPSLLETISLFSTTVTYICSANKFICTIVLDSTYKWSDIDSTYMIFVFLWLASLSTIVSRSIRVTVNGIISLFLMADQCTVSSLPVPLSVDTQVASVSWLLCVMLQWTLGCTCLFKLWLSPDICPEVGLLDHMAVLLLVSKNVFTY